MYLLTINFLKSHLFFSFLIWVGLDSINSYRVDLVQEISITSFFFFVMLLPILKVAINKEINISLEKWSSNTFVMNTISIMMIAPFTFLKRYFWNITLKTDYHAAYLKLCLDSLPFVAWVYAFVDAHLHGFLNLETSTENKSKFIKP